MDDGDGDHDDHASSSARRGAGPRLYHKKSRAGCARCKARRVKCDEARPACGGCSRHQVACVYPSPSRGRAPATTAHHTVVPSPPPPPPPSCSSSSSQPLHPRPRPPPPPPPMTRDVGTVAGDHEASRGASSRASNEEHLPAPDNQSAASVTSGTTRPPSSSGASVRREATDYLSHLTDPEILDIPESRDRRMWELRLLHNYMMMQTRQFSSPEIVARHGEQPIPFLLFGEKKKGGGGIGIGIGDDIGDDIGDGRSKFPGFVWGRELCDLALANDTILYSLLAGSAVEMWTRTTDRTEREHLLLLQQKYQSMALREQRQAVANLSRDNADDVCMSALTILQNAFILVQTVPTSPWQPPLAWLRMGKGTASVLIVARGHLGFRDGEKITRFVNSMDRIGVDDVFKDEYRTHLTWLLDNDGGSSNNIGDHELVNNELTVGIYNKVLSYIGYMQKAMHDKEPLYMVYRRFICFAIWIPELYHEFLAQRRPRALITMAHYFKLWIPYGDLWQIGENTGEKQVRAIYQECPVEWRHKLDPIFDEYGLEHPISASTQSDRMEEAGS